MVNRNNNDKNINYNHNEPELDGNLCSLVVARN